MELEEVSAAVEAEAGSGESSTGGVDDSEAGDEDSAVRNAAAELEREEVAAVVWEADGDDEVSGARSSGGIGLPFSSTRMVWMCGRTMYLASLPLKAKSSR